MPAASPTPHTARYHTATSRISRGFLPVDFTDGTLPVALPADDLQPAPYLTACRSAAAADDTKTLLPATPRFRGFIHSRIRTNYCAYWLLICRITEPPTAPATPYLVLRDMTTCCAHYAVHWFARLPTCTAAASGVGTRRTTSHRHYGFCWPTALRLDDLPTCVRTLV